MRPAGRRVPRDQSRRRPHHPAHRARDARRDGAGAAHRRPAPRRGDRPRLARASGARPGGARVLPRRGDRGLMLSVKNIDLYYGDAQALSDVSLEVPKGEIVAIVGANGAGKTSLIRTIAGIEHARSGSISFKDKPIGELASHAICNLGIGQVAEGRQIFPSLSVLENLELGAMLPRARADAKRTLDDVLAMFPILSKRSGQSAGTLSGGEQQMLAIGRCLMGAPELIMFDEPSLGLAPLIV